MLEATRIAARRRKPGFTRCGHMDRDSMRAGEAQDTYGFSEADVGSEHILTYTG